MTLQDVLRLAQTTDWGQNRDKLFYLARGVKTLEHQEEREWAEGEMIERAFLPWYRTNEYLNQEKTQEDYEELFLTAYDCAKTTLLDSPLDVAWRAAEARPFPQAALQFKDPEYRQLVLWCQELQRLVGAGNCFFLSCRSVQERFKLSAHSLAATRLHRLERKGVIREEEKGSAKTRLASRYRYLPPIEDGLLVGTCGREAP